MQFFDWIHLVTGPCEHDVEPSDPIKGKDFIQYLSDWSVLSATLFRKLAVVDTTKPSSTSCLHLPCYEVGSHSERILYESCWYLT